MIISGVGILFLPGCGDQRALPAAESTPEGGHVVTFRDGTVAVINEPDPDFMDAGVEGTVAVLDGTPCWGVEDSFGETYVVVWPHETTVTADRDGLRVSPQVTLRLGDEMSSSGGYIPPDAVLGFDVEEVCGDVERVVVAKEFSPAT